MVTYEETPILEPIPDDQQTSSHVAPEAAQIFETPPTATDDHRVSEPTKAQRKNPIGTILFVALLFGLGVWLSSQLRSFFAPASTAEVPVPTVFPTTTGFLPAADGTASSSGATAPSIRQTVYSGARKSEIANVSYMMPSSMKELVCDNSSCTSQWVAMPNGTRFTVAPRGAGELLPDFRGAILTDADGKEFTMREVAFAGKTAYEYVGDFTGRTGGGYTFSRMRGVLIPVSDSLAIDFNHFTPVGSASDFVKDDRIFDAIVASLTASR